MSTEYEDARANIRALIDWLSLRLDQAEEPGEALMVVWPQDEARRLLGDLALLAAHPEPERHTGTFEWSTGFVSAEETADDPQPG